MCSEEVTLSPEEKKSVKCYYTPQSEGNYEVEADGLRRDFNVIRPITPTPLTPVPQTPTPTSTPSPTTTATESPTPVPGFEVVSAIAGLLAVAYLLRRK
ncbi:MAG: PGF-CTERM sorting domain-containing protein [Methanophagales archaeon]|nr:PGF-CTERM sorting domain-containing protein [Methanophagales archaeon]